MERYAANDRASIELIKDPWTAFAMASKIVQVVNTLVGRPIHVAMVNGLKRKLNRDK